MAIFNSKLLVFQRVIPIPEVFAGADPRLLLVPNPGSSGCEAVGPVGSPGCSRRVSAGYGLRSFFFLKILKYNRIYKIQLTC